MNIFSDYHHSDLYYSLQLLFEKRLGWNLYRPIGMKWYEEGFWDIFNHSDTAKQYLDFRDYKPKDGTLPLNDSFEEDRIYHCEDHHNSTSNKAITLPEFKKMDIDIVVASIPAHIKPFKELARMKGAKFIFQMGNVFPEVVNNLHEIPNLMANTLPSNLPGELNWVSYHQEFDLDIFKPTNLPPEREINAFINVYQNNGGFYDFLILQGMMPHFSFKSYGGQCVDGSVNTTVEMATLMQRSYLGFHSKFMGDGYGHTLYNWYAVGRPVITRLSDYKDKLGEELLVDGETCFDIDRHGISGVHSLISNLHPEQYLYMTQAAYNRFKEKVDFNAEESKIRNFLDKLK